MWSHLPCGKPTLFFVGKMFQLKDCLKELFSARYGDIQYANKFFAAWYVHLNDGVEDTIAAWLKDMGCLCVWFNHTANLQPNHYSRQAQLLLSQHPDSLGYLG